MTQGTEEINLLKDIIIPLAAVIISVVAVIFTAISLRMQRRHNIKSIKPIGKIRIGDYETNIYIRIDNSGVGPLILKKVILNGSEIPPEAMLLDRIPNGRKENIRWRNYTGGYENRTIPANTNLELIRWTPETDYEKSDEELENTKRNLRESFQNWSLKIEYTDIYDSEIFTDDLKLDWFGRNYK